MKRVQILVAGAFSLAVCGWSLYGGAVVGSLLKQEAEEVQVSPAAHVGIDLSSVDTEDSFDFESEEFQALLKQLQTHIEGLKENMPEEEQKAFSEMENEMKVLGEKLHTLKAEAAEFAHKKASHKLEVQELRTRLAQLEKDKAELTETIARLEQEALGGEDLATKHDELALVDATLEETTQALESKRSEKREVKSKLQSHEAEIAHLEKQMDAQSEFDFTQLFKDLPDEDPSATFDAELVPADEKKSEGEELFFDYADESPLVDETDADFPPHDDELSPSSDASQDTDALALEESPEKVSEEGVPDAEIETAEQHK